MADRPRDLAERMARRRKMAGKPGRTVGDGYHRQIKAAAPIQAGTGWLV